jgi:hypothetical protein
VDVSTAIDGRDHWRRGFVSFSAGMASADFAGATEFNLEELWHYWKGLQR